MDSPIRAHVDEQPVVPLLPPDPPERDEDVAREHVPSPVRGRRALLDDATALFRGQGSAVPLPVHPEGPGRAGGGVVPQEGVLHDTVALPTHDGGGAHVGNDDDLIVAVLVERALLVNDKLYVLMEVHELFVEDGEAVAEEVLLAFREGLRVMYSCG